MRLRLQRRQTQPATTAPDQWSTVGELFEVSPAGVLGRRLCFTCEDAIREPERPVAVPDVGAWVRSWKVPGQTAIPSGTYRVIITPSARFKRFLPLLVDVPGFSGIRIHPGNTHEDTEGCILPGRIADRGAVWQSRLAFDALYATLELALLAGEPVSLQILNP